MYILMIIFLIESKFNTNTDIRFQEFDSEISCMSAKSTFSSLAVDSGSKILSSCVKK